MTTPASQPVLGALTANAMFLTLVLRDGPAPLAAFRGFCDHLPGLVRGEFGTFFVGYAREPGRIETMLRNMFVGVPPGNHDRILDVSTAVTGGLFFVPSTAMLAQIAAAQVAAAAGA